MPDGEFFTGPVEDSVEGEVTFHLPAVIGGREVSGVRLRFEAGKVVDASAERGEEFLIQLLDTDEGARRLGELGIGTNYAIDRGTREVLLDEKIGGTVHMAVGAVYPESGGVNESAVHTDLVCDLRLGGKIEVDGERLPGRRQVRRLSSSHHWFGSGEPARRKNQIVRRQGGEHDRAHQHRLDDGGGAGARRGVAHALQPGRPHRRQPVGAGDVDVEAG